MPLRRSSPQHQHRALREKKKKTTKATTTIIALAHFLADVAYTVYPPPHNGSPVVQKRIKNYNQTTSGIKHPQLEKREHTPPQNTTHQHNTQRCRNILYTTRKKEQAQTGGYRTKKAHRSPSSPLGSFPKAESQDPFQSVERNTVWCDSWGHRRLLQK